MGDRVPREARKQAGGHESGVRRGPSARPLPDEALQRPHGGRRRIRAVRGQAQLCHPPALPPLESGLWEGGQRTPGLSVSRLNQGDTTWGFLSISKIRAGRCLPELTLKSVPSSPLQPQGRGQRSLRGACLSWFHVRVPPPSPVLQDAPSGRGNGQRSGHTGSLGSLRLPAPGLEASVSSSVPGGDANGGRWATRSAKSGCL